MFKNYCAALFGIVLLTGSELYAKQPSLKEKASPKEADTSQKGGFGFTGDFIYWQAREDGLSIGSTGQVDPSGTNSLTSFGHVAYPNFTYAPGFKFGIEVDFGRDQWDSRLNYTWFESATCTASLKNNPTAGGISSVFRLGGSGDFIDSLVSSSWKLFFNEVDWELGKTCSFGCYFKVRPHIGLKGAWNHQNFKATSVGTDPANFLVINPGDTLLTSNSQDQHFWGIGMRMGVNTEWFFAKGFSIYGNLAFSELYGQFLDRLRVIGEDVTVNVAVPTTLKVQNLHQIQPVFELALGLGYEVSFGKDEKCHFFIKTGWEQQIWWNQNHFLLLNTRTSSNLTFQGLDVKMGFLF